MIPVLEMSFAEAKELFRTANWRIWFCRGNPSNFGRIAAQNRQAGVIQKLREAERLIYEHFLEREGENVTGTIQRIEAKTVFIGQVRTEGIMLASDQIANERYELGRASRHIFTRLKTPPKGPNIFVSVLTPFFWPSF
jgi:N utilization substance protein A